MPTLSHKIKLDPTVKQERYFRRACGTARFCFNWGLARWQELYGAGEKPSANALKREFNALYHEQFPWVSDVHRDCHAQPFAQLQAAFQGFFAKRTKYPRFKKRGQHDAFYVANDKFRCEGKSVRLPVIGWVRMREALRFDGKVMSGTVSRQADGWYLSVSVQLPDSYSRERTGDGMVGVDLGVKDMATLSTGEHIEGPKPLRTYVRRLRRAQKSLSRKQKGSNNRKKQAVRVARLHKRVRDIRVNFLHKLTHRLFQQNQLVATEQLRVANMMRNHCLARSISDIGMGEFLRQCSYKAPLYGSVHAPIGAWYPSSKMCSDCGAVKTTLKLSERVYVCTACGSIKDRDENASANILAEGIRTAGLAEPQACGPGSAGTSRGAKLHRVEAGTMPCSLVGT